MRDWYCAQTKPHGERRALAHITDVGLHAWLPELRVPKRRHGRPVMLVEPLFPCYLFVDMDAASPRDWEAVRWAPGIRQVVGDGTVPVAVPAPAMAVLLARFSGGAVDAPSRFFPGVQVRVTAGPMARLEGLVLACPTPQHRVRVLMRLLHRDLPIEFDTFDLEPIA